MRAVYKNLFFFIAVFVSRLPFIFNGYGLDGDCWAVALAARQWFRTGIYEASRFPGYPVHEFLCGLVSGIGGAAPNLLTACFTALAALFFVMTLNELRFRSPYLAGFALAFVPIIYIDSAIVIDYNFALAFLMIAFYFVTTDKPILSGLAIGLAIGCRITSGVMLLPYALMLVQQHDFKRNLWRIFHVTVFALTVGALCYVPSYWRYGFSFLTYYDVPYPSLPRIFYRFFIDTWGVLGLTALCFGVLFLFLPSRFTGPGYLFPRSVNIKYVIAWLLAIDFFVIAFIKLPMEAGYMTPAIPFVLLIFGKYLIRPAFNFFCILILLSPFLMGITPLNRVDASSASSASVRFNVSDETLNMDALKGPVIGYESRKHNGLLYVRSILQSLDTVTIASCLITGQWYNSLIYFTDDTLVGNVVLVPHVSQNVLLEQLADRRKLYYLPRQDELNRQLKSVDPAHFGALLYR